MEEGFDALVVGEGLRFAGQVIAGDIAAAAADEVQVGRKGDEPLVDVLPAYTGGATQGGLEYLDRADDGSSSGWAQC